MNYNEFLPTLLNSNYNSVNDLILASISLGVINPVSDFIVFLHIHASKTGSTSVNWQSKMQGKVFCSCRKSPPNVFNTMLSDINQLNSKGKVFLDIISKYALYSKRKKKCCKFLYDNTDNFKQYFNDNN